MPEAAQLVSLELRPQQPQQRQRSEAREGVSSGSSGKRERAEEHFQDLHPDADVSALQKELVSKFVSTIDASKESIVITNPRAAGARAGRGAASVFGCALPRCAAQRT